MVPSKFFVNAPSSQTISGTNSGLGVWSQALMVHYFLRHGGMHCGPSSSWQRHDDRGNPSSNTAYSREPEDRGQAPRHQSTDRSQMAQAQLRRRSADRSETAELNRAVDRGGGDCRRVPSAHLTAARRLPVCAASDDPASDPIIVASLSEAARHLPPAAC